MRFPPTPSPSSQKLWRSLSKSPIRMDLSMMGICFVTLMFSVSDGAYSVANRDTYEYPGRKGSGVSGDASRILAELLPPLLTALLSLLTIYLHTSRTLQPGLSVTVSVLMLCGWAAVLFCWIWGMGELWVEWGYGGEVGPGVFAVRIIKLVGAAGVIVLYLVYMTYASIAVDRLRKARKKGTYLEMEDAVESET